MIIHTRFGDWEVEENKIITMEGPILGFEGVKEYVLLPAGEGVPVYWFQAVREVGVVFMVMDPLLVQPRYAPNLKTACERLEIRKEEEMALIAIVTVRENPFSASLNLRAPILINARTRKGRQVVLEEDTYPLRYPIGEIMGGKEAEGILSLSGEAVKRCG